MNLDALVEQVMANNPELAFFRTEIDAARGGRKQAGIPANPELSADIGRKRTREGGFSSEGTAWSVSVVQTFEFPGRRALRKAIANHDLELAEMGLAQFQAALRGRARTLGFGLLVAQQKAETSSGVADRLQDLLSFLVQREPGGIAPLIELRIIEASVATFRKRSIEASLALQAALFDLNLLRGEPLETPLRMADVDLSFPKPPPLPVLLDEARENNFEIRMRRAELEQQGLRLALSRNQRWPGISVGPFVARESADARETVAGIGISLPLPAWNRNAGSIEVEEARREQGETSLFLARLRVEKEVMEQFLAYQLNREELERWGPDSLRRFHEAAQLGDRHYRLGSLPAATYIELQREYLDALDSIRSLQVEALAAQQELEVLIGLPPGRAISLDRGTSP